MAPRTKEKVEVIRFNKMLQIEHAALDVFAELGYHAASVSIIAKRANISKGLIYNYYSSKEELLRSLVFRTFKEMLELFNFDEEIGNKNSTFGISEIINRSFDWVEKNRDFLRIYFGIMLQPQVLKIVEKQMWEMASRYFISISRLFEANQYENPMVEVRYLNSMLDGIFLNYVLDPGNFPFHEMKHKIINQYSKK